MIIEKSLIGDKSTTVNIDTDHKIITLNKIEIIPFEKISYLVLKIGNNIFMNNYIEFHAKNQPFFSIYVTKKQISELRKFFNIRTELLERTYEIKKNYKYCLIVSEPWDFGGNIVGTVLDLNEKRIIFKSDCMLEIQGINSDILILHSRDGKNCNELPLRVNASIASSNYDASKTDEQLLENSKFVIIGSLRKCNLLMRFQFYYQSIISGFFKKN